MDRHKVSLAVALARKHICLSPTARPKDPYLNKHLEFFAFLAANTIAPICKLNLCKDLSCQYDPHHFGGSWTM